MLITMQSQATEENVRNVVQVIESLGYKAHTIPGAEVVHKKLERVTQESDLEALH